MRAWWSDYGAYVISGIVLGAIVLFGINYYQSRTLEAQYAASSLYDALANHVAEGNLDEAEAVIAEIDAGFGDTAYASQAKLAMARLFMDKNRDQDAADTLTQLINSNASEEFRHIARIRLAKILLYQDKAREVVELLEGQPQVGAFAARYAESLGDAHFVLGELELARVAYQRALGEPNQAATVDQRFVQLKLMDLPLDAFGTDDSEVSDPEALEVDSEVADEEAE